MDREIVKSKPLTKEESKSLLKLIECSKVITRKTTNATNNKLKNEEWIRIAASFNATATDYPRTPQQLRLKWENLKKNSRKRNAKIKMNKIKTSGGPAEYIPPDDILDKVTSLLENTASTFTVPSEGDSEIITMSDIQLEIDGDGSNGSGSISSDGSSSGGSDLVESLNNLDPLQTSIDTGGESVIKNEVGNRVITNGQVLDKTDHNRMTPKKPKYMLNIPRAAKRSIKRYDSRPARDKAIADSHITLKQKCLKNKIEHIKLDIERIKLEIERIELDKAKIESAIEKSDLEKDNLKLDNERLKLVIIEQRLRNKKLALEVEKMKKQ